MATTGNDALLRSYIANIAEQASQLSRPAADRAVVALAHLVVGYSTDDARRAIPSSAPRKELLVEAHHLIERDLHRPDLTPSRVAAQLMISVRKLHLVFEPSGESFSRRVLGRRLARADQLLREVPRMSVTQAAFAAGFESPSTFFRSYRAAYGASPGERRNERRE